MIDAQALAGVAAVGELSLSGSVMGVRGALSMAIAAKEHGLRAVMLPAQSAGEAACVEGLEVLPVAHLSEAITHLRGKARLSPLAAQPYAGCLRRAGRRRTLPMCAASAAPSGRWRSPRRRA